MKAYQWAAAILIVAALPTIGSAQTDGRFTGTVLDQSGAFVAGAVVVVKNERTGEERTATANSQGLYVIPNLKPSVYTIRATFGNFAPLEYTGMTLAVGQEFSLDLELHAAGVTETVSVVGQTTAVDLSSARIGVNVGEREIDELPLNGRQMSQLMLQAPGSQNTGTGTWSDIRFSGRAVEQNVIRFDGVEASSVISSSPGQANAELATPFKLQASLENVQEFRIESNMYPAESGTGTGGQINVVTKSGTNSFHGTAFEYYRNDQFDSPNYFDTLNGLDKSKLKLNQYGGSMGGPFARDKAFFFGSYEGYKVDAGANLIEYVPSAAAWARAVPAIAVLRPAFLAPGASILPGLSPSPDFDVAQLQANNQTREDAFSVRVDYKLSPNWSTYVRASHDKGTADTPETVAGRVFHVTDDPTNVVFNLLGVLGTQGTNEFKFGFNHVPTTASGVTPAVPGVDLSATIINLTGGLANVGIAGQGSASGVAVVGGLVRTNSNLNGRAQPYDPYSLTFADSFTHVAGAHLSKFGGEARLIRMSTDRLGGTTYSFANITNFLANIPTTVQYAGDLSSPSPFNNGATGERHPQQEYYIAYAQDEWHLGNTLTFSYGLRYEYYTPLQDRDDLQVKFNVDTGVIEPNTTAPFKSKKDNFEPRVALTYAPGKNVFRGGFGIFVGPGQTEDQIQPIESDRASAALTSNIAYPVDTPALISAFTSNPNTRAYQPRVYTNEYSIPEKVYQYSTSFQRELGTNFAVTAAYVGSVGRNMFLRGIANNTKDLFVNPTTGVATPIREFSILTRDANGNVTGVQQPYAELDSKTSGGHNSYNSMMLGLSKRSANGLALNVQYTLGYSKGNTGGSNEAQTGGNSPRALSDWDYDNGYNFFDVRHTFNGSAIYSIPYGKGRKFGSNAGALSEALLGNWDVGGILNGRSGVPVEVLITRPDIVYRDGSGNVFANQITAADIASGVPFRTPVINTPRGGSTRDRRRPDLVPGVDPFVKDGGLVYLNPAAFATPQPGTYGNLVRNSLHGPNFKQVDLYFAKHFPIAGKSNIEFRAEVFNLFNTTNFANPPAKLPQAIPNNSLTEANRVQPGQPYTAAAAGPFGILSSTVSRTVGLGTQRQWQFALRFSF